MDWGFSWLYSFVNSVWSVLASVLTWFADGVKWAGQSLLYTLVDGFLTSFLALIQALDVSTFLGQISGAWGFLPCQVVYVVTACCLPQGIAIIAAAITLRLTLNLIPSWITRV